MTQCRLCRSVEAVEDGAMCPPCQDEADEFWSKFAGAPSAEADEFLAEFLGAPRTEAARRSQIALFSLGLAFAITATLFLWEHLG